MICVVMLDVAADAPLSESASSQSDFIVLNGNGPASLNDEERMGSAMSMSPTLERRSRKSEGGMHFPIR